MEQSREKLDTLSKRLRHARKDAGFKKASDFARHIGMTDREQTYISHENGQRQPKLPDLQKYAKALKVNLNWLINGTGDMIVNAAFGDQGSPYLYPPDVGVDGEEVVPPAEKMSPRKEATAAQASILDICEGLSKEAKAKLDVEAIITILYETVGREVPAALDSKKNKRTG